VTSATATKPPTDAFIAVRQVLAGGASEYVARQRPIWRSPNTTVSEASAVVRADG